jgi:hypothetical protein
VDPAVRSEHFEWGFALRRRKIVRVRRVGYLTAFGSALALALAPVMVAIKYMTGWAIIPEPFWVPAARAVLASWFPNATPPQLWTFFGTAYSIGLLLMLVGFVALERHLKGRTALQQTGYWLVVAGLLLVLPGDAIHSWTWHQNGLTVPTPGTNPVANTAYAVHMMGMNLIMVGTAVLGYTALRRRTLAPWLASALLLVFPAALVASLGLLPTTPSGALWLLSAVMVACGVLMARGRAASMSGAGSRLGPGPS